MSKKDLSIFSAALCCALVVIGCGDDDDDTPSAGAGGFYTAGSGGALGGSGGGGGRSGSGGSAGASGGGGASGSAGGAGTSGSGGSAGSAGSAGDDGDAGVPDEDGGMPDDGELMPGQARAKIMPFGTGTVTGTATFTQMGLMVGVVVQLQNCPDGAHPVHIHQGTSCADANAQGMHWDTTRGEGIPDVNCAGGTGSVSYVRPGTPGSIAWSVAGSNTTNVIGHAFVVHTGTDRIGCGLIAGP